MIKRFNNAINKLRISLGCCDLCGGACDEHVLLCRYCLKDLPLFDLHSCQFDLLNYPAIDQALTKNKFDHLICLAPYHWPFTYWLKQLKYQGRFELAPLFAFLLAKQWLALITPTGTQPQLLLSVPLHINKWQIRGYNQAHLIAKAFSRHTKIPYHALAIERIKHTDNQVGQSGVTRRKNLRRAFSLNTSKFDLPEHVLLLDDVVTTGSTANEIVQLLKKHGVCTVTLISICLALPNIKA